MNSSRLGFQATTCRTCRVLHQHGADSALSFLVISTRVQLSAPPGASGLPTCRGLLLNPACCRQPLVGQPAAAWSHLQPPFFFAPTLPKVTTATSRLPSHPTRAGTSCLTTSSPLGRTPSHVPTSLPPPAHGYCTGPGPCVVGLGDSSCRRGPAPSSRPLVSQTTARSPSEWNTSSQGEV